MRRGGGTQEGVGHAAHAEDGGGGAGMAAS